MNCSDLPLDNLTTDGVDGLDRKRAVLALERLLCGDEVKTPLTLGLFGGWGLGKTSMMRSLQRRIGERKEANRIVVWFDAWVYARQEEALWRALLLQVVAALRVLAEKPDGTKLQRQAFDEAYKAFNARWISEDAANEALKKLDNARASLYRTLTHKENNGVRVNWWGALPLAADVMLTAVTAGLNKQVAEAVGGKGTEGGITAALAKWCKGKDTQDAVKLIERQYTEHYVEQVASLEQFQQTFRDVLTNCASPELRLYIFVDDLDRCLPEDAVAALEAIKLFLDSERCLFVLGMDRQVVEQGIKVRYASFEQVGFDARAYLDKIIQIPFTLPPLGAVQIERYLDTLIDGNPAFQDCRDLFVAAAPPNPRTLKRILNALLLILYLDTPEGGEHNTRRTRYLAKLVLMQICFEKVWQSIVADNSLLTRLERVAGGKPDITVKLDLNEYPGIKKLLTLEPKFTGIMDTEFDALLTMTRTTETT